MIIINNLEELDNFILENEDNINMLYFGATWCGPCIKLKDKINNESKEIMPKLVVGYIDIDNEDTSKICNRYKVTSLPTLIFIKLINFKVEIIDRVDGYDWIKIVMIYNRINIEN